MKKKQTRSAHRDATAIARTFDLPSSVDTVEPYGEGLINDTFLVKTGSASFVLQRINDAVFPEPEGIMSNLAELGAHLADRKQNGFRIPDLVPTRDGSPFARDDKDAIWRLMEFIPNSTGLRRINTLEQAREVGRVLGRFHSLVGDLDPARLAETLPGFHVTPLYVERLTRAFEKAPAGRLVEVRQAMAFAAARRKCASALEDARERGLIPVRVIHGDPKLDNILFDHTTGRAVSLIDLDTVQPGLVHNDLGDCLRSCCNRVGESANANEAARLDLDVCRAILGAYASEAKGLLQETEIELLYDAIRLLPFELGVRFLTDHLEGDRYFRVTAPGQNLSKARVQFALVADIEGKEREIRRIIADSFRQRADQETKTPG